MVVQMGGVVVQFCHLADFVKKQLMVGILQLDSEGKNCLEHNSGQNSKEFSPTKAAFPF